MSLISGVIRCVLQRKREEDEQEDTADDNEVTDGEHQKQLFIA